MQVADAVPATITNGDVTQRRLLPSRPLSEVAKPGVQEATPLALAVDMSTSTLPSPSNSARDPLSAL